MKKTKRIFSGFVGDVVLGGSYTNPLLFLPKFISKGWLKKRLELTADNEFMNTRVLAEHNDHIAVYLKDDMRYAQLKYAINELIAHHLALGITLDRSFFQVLLPFVDYRLFDCLAKIRPEERILSVGYIRMLKRNFPEIASIPWARTGYRLYTSLYKLFLSRLRHRLLPKTINYVDFHRWFSGPLKNWIDDILISNGEFWLKTIGKDEIERLRKNPLVTSALLTVELTMRCLKS